MISWGCAATHWLARALNSHADIFCVHAGNFSRHQYGRAPYLDGPEYLQVIGQMGCSYAAAGDVHGVNIRTIMKLRAVPLAAGLGARLWCANRSPGFTARLLCSRRMCTPVPGTSTMFSSLSSRVSTYPVTTCRTRYASWHFDAEQHSRRTADSESVALRRFNDQSRCPRRIRQ